VLARLAGLGRQPERAARLLGAAEAIGERTTATTSVHDEVRRRALAVARAALGEPAFAAHAAAGRSLALEDAVAEAVGVAAAIAAAPEAAREPGGALTDRERDVLRLLVEGRSNPEIGAALFISPTTARNHVNRILAKLDVESRAAAVAYAVRHALV
jgi:DNA-binding NarL/FixJ family response regulator